MRSSGKFILLFGTSCAGKSTLASKLQECAKEHFLSLSLDNVFATVSSRWAAGPDGPLATKGFYYRSYNDDDGRRNELIHCGEIGRNILHGMRRAAAAFARSGNNVIFDDMFIEEDAIDDWSAALAGIDVVSVQVTAPIEVLQEREAARVRRRRVGLALGHKALNEAFAGDLVINTQDGGLEAAAKMILDCLAETGPRAIERKIARPQ
jgi:chloramphenicol 3-O phosphotransferase